MEVFIHFWEAFSDYFRQKEKLRYMDVRFIFVYKDRPDSSFFTEHCREKTNRKEKRDSFFAFNSGLSRAHCVQQISQLVFFLVSL